VALDDGHTVIVEKPLCLTFEDLQTIAAIKTGKLICNLPLRHQLMPAVRKPYHIEADYLWGRADRLTGWRKNCEGYSFVLGGGIHVADAIVRVMGARPVLVSALAQTMAHFPAPTMVTCIGEFDDGRSFSMEINCAYTGTHQWRVCQWGPDGKSEVIGMSSDKRQTVRDAITFPHRAKDPGIAAHALCFAIERALKNKRVEQVIYP
jgi:predicted dehydrogenase